MKFITTPARSKIMRAIKSKGTKEEILLGKSLWSLGLRYRKNNNKIFGCPDFTFSKYKVAIFIDGEFFHGYEWEKKKTTIKANRDYWIPKIERNMQRDKEVNEFLTLNGWVVLRFWAKDVKKNLERVIAVTTTAIEKAKDVGNT